MIGVAGTGSPGTILSPPAGTSIRDVCVTLRFTLPGGCVPCERFGRGVDEPRNALLEARRLWRFAELAPAVAPIDGLAEDRCLPERERLEPGEPANLCVCALLVAGDQVVAGGKALGCRGGRG